MFNKIREILLKRKLDSIALKFGTGSQKALRVSQKLDKIIVKQQLKLNNVSCKNT